MLKPFSSLEAEQHARITTMLECRFTGLELPSTTVFDYPTAEGLSEMIVAQLPACPVPADTQPAPCDKSVELEGGRMNEVSGAFVAIDMDGEFSHSLLCAQTTLSVKGLTES